MNGLRSCTICVHSSTCWRCDREHNLFQLDKKKLEEEVDLGIMSKRTARKILEENEKDQGIPGQLRLKEGDWL